MRKNKINKIVITMFISASISVGLFAYQNFYLNKINKNEIMFVAKNDIPSMTNITGEMFKPVSIPKGGILDIYVTDLSKIIGKNLRGGLLMDEPLTKSRLINIDETQCDLEIKLESDTTMTIKDNEYVNVYVSLKDSQNKIEIRKIFGTKKVKISGVGASSTESNDTTVSVKVTEEELNSYYDAKERGKIIVAKNNSLDANKDITDKKYDPNSQEAKTAITPKEDDGKSPAISVIEKEIEEGETLDTLSIKYKTTISNIKKINQGKTDFKVGDKIILPAN